VRIVGAVVLVAATLVCLASMGGAMLVAVWALVPLHWLAARGRGPVTVAFWALLAGASAFVPGALWTYVLTRAEVLGLLVGAGAFVAVVTWFLRSGADAYEARLRTGSP